MRFFALRVEMFSGSDQGMANSPPVLHATSDFVSTSISISKNPGARLVVAKFAKRLIRAPDRPGVPGEFSSVSSIDLAVWNCIGFDPDNEPSPNEIPPGTAARSKPSNSAAHEPTDSRRTKREDWSHP